MATCRADPGVTRVEMNGVQFPLGVYPVEPMTPVQGYRVEFEPADGDDQDGEWEEWPDRYAFEIVVSADRIEALCRQLFYLLPGRLYPILDVMGHDAYREIDPYIAYDLVGAERFFDGLRRFRAFFYEDGLCGFGAMCDEPTFFYIFVDEHKIITVRAATELKERVDKVLEAFDLKPVENPAGADAVSHEHRSVLVAPDDQPDLLVAEEIVEQLRDDWRLRLNVDADSNVDDDGTELGVTAWRCVVRCAPTVESPPKYAEVLCRAGCLREAEDFAFDAAEGLIPKDGAASWEEVVLVATDRVDAEMLTELLGAAGAKDKRPKTGAPTAEEPEPGILSARWLE